MMEEGGPSQAPSTAFLYRNSRHSNWMPLRRLIPSTRELTGCVQQREQLLRFSQMFSTSSTMEASNVLPSTRLPQGRNWIKTPRTWKTVKLPKNLQNLQDGEDEVKDMAFSSDIVEKIQQRRYEEAMLKSANVQIPWRIQTEIRSWQRLQQRFKTRTYFRQELWSRFHPTDNRQPPSVKPLQTVRLTTPTVLHQEDVSNSFETTGRRSRPTLALARYQPRASDSVQFLGRARARNRFYRTASSCTRNPKNYRSLQTESQISSYSGRKEHNCVLSEQAEESIVRVEAPKAIFQDVGDLWGGGQLKVDVFASRENKRTKVFWSYLLDPEVAATDAFQQEWHRKGLYLHPPWQLIPRVTHKLQEDKVNMAVLVTPNWPSQYWWPMVKNLS
ncbi:hypothetical protein [Parasitella parasitica]|uniref:Uncharacterized protein n=1 Tax=Parasitella parasitica TaxID=35722 RepID=A0A0B7NES1_9FUNG|nr:hypothetical protein [Parasitella parasitica]